MRAVIQHTAIASHNVISTFARNPAAPRRTFARIGIV